MCPSNGSGAILGSRTFIRLPDPKVMRRLSRQVGPEKSVRSVVEAYGFRRLKNSIVVYPLNARYQFQPPKNIITTPIVVESVNVNLKNRYPLGSVMYRGKLNAE
jgi:hypothetical protein